MLEGVRVLDFTQYLPGPFATQRLADLGAEVIKVEPPNGDLARHMADGLVYEANNRSKESIAINLKDATKGNALCELMKTVDVVIESFRPGVMKRIGLHYEKVKELKSDIIYCSLTGFGQAGTHAHLGSHDLNYQGLGGLLSQYSDENGKPVQPTFTTVDYGGGVVASERISAALFQKERTGKGCYIDLALNDVMLSMLGTHAAYQAKKGKHNGPDFIDGSVVCYGLYETKDDRFVTLAALEPHFWKNFCQGVGKLDWLPHAFSKKGDDTHKGITALFKERSLAEWTSFGEQHDCCLFPVLHIEEVINHSYGSSRGLVMKKDGQVHMLTSPYGSLKASPLLGAHNDRLGTIK
ncbi:CaiB/BaiF CoA transferase family protein [Guptibacillus algicola]|uniref:CaiB/BaiF CoA transferase family protein n=1 Tax=Guptibacillus algicola TaxID=225844 RepID=UPI001CD19615|nr:CoA transferase [Alkalihalobacillus algicola]MCA0988553.1 CoA transferase [Alkalihalobacillus algicola]